MTRRYASPISTETMCAQMNSPCTAICMLFFSLSQNWETSIAASWILQIILSELLDVPTTLETGIADKNNNFYNGENRMDYGNSDAVDRYASFQNAFDAEGGDCSVYKSGNGEVGYFPCAHSLPETWNNMEQILVSGARLECSNILFARTDAK